jgi:hypothetical protein
VPVTEELVDRLADEAAAGYDVAALRRRGGRRPMGVAPAEVVPVRLDPELRTALAARADADDTSVSDVIPSGAPGLAARGLTPHVRPPSWSAGRPLA